MDRQPFDDEPFDDEPFDDELFDVDAVAAGAWVPGPYGEGDELGTYNEVTPQKTAAALATLAGSTGVRTYHLGETLFNGFPAFGDRQYHQQLLVTGYQPPEGFEGILRRTEALAANRLTYHEERVATTYNLGSKINGLLHCGVGSMFYNGFTGDDLARTWGVAHLDTVSWGPPIVTRGFLVDVAAHVAAEGGPVFASADGRPVLVDNHRVTLEELRGAIERQGLPPFEPGDAIMVRTGWNTLVRTDPERYLSASPGPWLRETRWLAASRPAVVGIDSWYWGTLDPQVMQGHPSACHQELGMRFGVRFGEGMQLEELAAAGVDRFVFCHTPLRAEGATSSSSPAMAMAGER